MARGVCELADDEADFTTFMLMDVKGLTSFSEKHGAKVMVSALNRIFAAHPSPDQTLAAVQRILLMLKEYKVEHFSVRIGINSCRAVRATVGSGERREYTYIGDAFNVVQGFWGLTGY